MYRAKSLSAGLAAILMLAGVSGDASAQDATLDLASITCKDFMKLKDRDREAVMSYFFGYAGGKSGSTVLDLEKTASMADTVVDDCLSNPDSKAMETFDKQAM